MSAMMQNFSKMMNGNAEMPDSIKNILNSMGNNSNQSKNEPSSEFENKSENNNSSNNNHSDDRTNNIFENFDMNTFFKMQQIMNSMNSKQDDSRTNLLKSLKPYLKESRKSKVDQYIQLMKMGKIIEIMNPLGGDNKHVQQ